MKTFKFLRKRQNVSERLSIEYTSLTNYRVYFYLRFIEPEKNLENPNLKVFNGTLLNYKKMIDDDPYFDWFNNQPAIHLIAFYSKRFQNCQRLGYMDYFKRNRHYFGKNQKLRIYYEAI